MCGIVGILSSQPVKTRLLDALRHLEYRGYDSTGVATLENRHLTCCRAAGKLTNLEERLKSLELHGTIGIGHTRWATHGRPTEANAHPHIVNRVAVVHNGIIENFRELKQELEEDGREFLTETDTEILAHLVDREMSNGAPPDEAVGAILPKLRGTFAAAFLFEDEVDLLICARMGLALVLGFGNEEMFLGSDPAALSSFTNKISYLEDGDWAVVTRGTTTIRDIQGTIVTRPVLTWAGAPVLVEKGSYRHFMDKEIHEQPEMIGRCLSNYVNLNDGRVNLPFDLPFDFCAVDRLTLVGCGTAYYAGLIAKSWFEKRSRLTVEVDVASEFRYREPPLRSGDLTVVISQSGETADTLASLRYAKNAQQHTLAIVNVATSTIARESEAVMPIMAGAEIGVASTKAFLCQLTTLSCLAIAAGRKRGILSSGDEESLVSDIIRLPQLLTRVLALEAQVQTLARELVKHPSVLYIGRGTSFPVALEGALKLKEISYIHAEGFAAGELKHGPIALVDDRMPIVVLAPYDSHFEKTLSNMQEVAARGGKIVLITDSRGAEFGAPLAFATLILPIAAQTLAPILYTVPLQLLAYHAAVLMGKDVDQPRNLAKSVTVE